MDDLRAHGEKVFAANCAACHQATGMGIPGTFPALVGSKVVMGPEQEQINIVLNGKPGTAMAPFKHLSDVDIAAVVTYGPDLLRIIALGPISLANAFAA